MLLHILIIITFVFIPANIHAVQQRIKIATEKPLLITLNDLIKSYLATHNNVFDVVYINNYDQIYEDFENDAEIDILITSNPDLLKLIKSKYNITHFKIAKDQLALYTQKNSPLYQKLKENTNISIADLLINIANFANIVCGDFDRTIDGIHTRFALESMNIFHIIQDRLITVADERAIELLISKGKTVGIMLKNHERFALNDVKTVYKFNDYDIIYSMAVMENAINRKDILDFIAYLNTATSLKIIENNGFAID